MAAAESGRQGIDGRTRQQAAGVSGEEALVGGLSSLDDSWIMLRGYRNRRGETDHVLVGPGGVWAVEVKRYATPLDRRSCARIVALIRRDHQFHNRRRDRRS